MKKKKAKKVLKKKVVKKAKKVAKKKVAPKNSMALATISYNDIVKAEMFDNKNSKGQALHLLKSYFPNKLIDFINMPTPKKYILERKGTGGKMFKYIPGWYARKCANYAFGFNQSFEIKSREIVGLSAIVEGRFIVTDSKTGKEILHKDDIGGHEIRFGKDKAQTPINAVNLANDYKAAATDCMKRCMAQIGFWKDVYGVNEAKDEGVRFEEEVVVLDKEDVIDGPDGKTAACKKCGDPISNEEYNFSKKLYGKPLCREHQDEAKRTK